MMGTTRTDGHTDAFDLTQFHGVFFEEAAENLADMESLLLALDVQRAEDEALNAIFRCAHSIKGGAATFGFEDLAQLTHVMETLLDRLRRRELGVTAGTVDTLLAAGDALRQMLARHRSGDGQVHGVEALVARLEALAQGPAAASGRSLTLTVGPLETPAIADSIVELFTEIPGLGAIATRDAAAGDDGLHRFQVTTTVSDAELLDLLSFHVSRDQVRIDAGTADPPLPASRTEPGVEGEAYGFFVDLPGAPASAPPTAVAAPTSRVPEIAAPRPELRPLERAAGTVGAESATIRVPVEKVDQLINLVGELVITQAMLAQTGRALDPVVHASMAGGLSDLERNTRLLQEAVMAIRMIPMSAVFSRFPRMLRDLAARLGKQVELQTLGEETELDKGLIEKITDPLTHLVRNALDHGIELPAERLAAGKPPVGTLTLAAAHQGGSIVIEVRDDGRGLDRERLLRKGAERGLSVSPSMTDAEVWALIFEPGFSTAAAVTDVSGRGVGMDVVKRNITALGGSVEIDSTAGQGLRVSVRLPLTLAIMDGMSVAVGEETYIVPLASVVESIHLLPQHVLSVAASGRVVRVRDDYLPLVALQAVFDVPGVARTDSGIMIVLEAEGRRIGLIVDALIGQHQVVVKNLEANYRKVPGVSGATILGDGRVALILDVAWLVHRARH